MAHRALCWAGTKPLASLLDGWLASILPHLWMAGAALIFPALVLAVIERWLPKRIREGIRKPLKELVGATDTPSGQQSSLDNRQPPSSRPEFTQGLERPM